MRIDAHHHLWLYNPQDYDWIDDRMHLLRRDFLPPELARNMASAKVDASIVVQARQTLQETVWLLEAAARSPAIVGVVGWAPIASPTFCEMIEQLCDAPLLKGLRHVVQAEASGFLDGAEFNKGIVTMTKHGLVYDILISAHQLTEATRFVDRHPNQIFVLDHLAKPDIVNRALNSWTTDIRELALRPNVVCKVSGMVTEADWHHWTPADLQPYFDTVLECFGPSRLMAGSDWPVLNLASAYTDWWKLIETWIAPISKHEREEIEGDVAARIYKLDLSGLVQGTNS